MIIFFDFNSEDRKFKNDTLIVGSDRSNVGKLTIAPQTFYNI